MSLPLDFQRLGPLLDGCPGTRRWVVAYSGGVDSHVLLHLLATAGLDRTLAAVYVDHGLHPASGRWGDHCAAVCKALGVAFQRLRADARPGPRESREDAARRARYGALGSWLQAGDALLTAHHRDDQAETLLLQLLRGAGPHGLAAMPAVADLDGIPLLRPLLDTDRAAILAYARHHGLAWVEDGSNADIGLDRNYLRHEVLPLLRRRWPALGRSLGRSARLCAEAARLLDRQADADLAAAACERPDALAAAVLAALDEARLRNALRRWLRWLELPAPGAAHLERVRTEVLAAGADRNPRLAWPGAELRRYRDRLYALAPPPAHDPGRVLPWSDPGRPLDLPGGGRLELCPATGAGLRAAALAGRALTVRFRRGGERFRPAGRRHGQELKKLLQEAGVPPWERSRLPLLYVDDDLAVVGELWVAATLAAAAGEAGLRLRRVDGAGP